MKLIDLLVQELPKRGGWPEGAAVIVQDRDGCLFYRFAIGGRTFAKIGIMLTIAEDYLLTEITREQYEAAMQQLVWDGKGLPPVGMKVEWWSEKYGWIDGTVAAHDEKYPLTAIIRHNDGYTGCTRGEIRTQADKKRDEAGLALYHAINWSDEATVVSPSRMEDYKKAYDAIAAGKIPGVKVEE